MQIIMQSTLAAPAANPMAVTDLEALVSGLDAATLNVYILYEDVVAGCRATQALDRVAQRISPETDFQFNLLQFELLQLASLRELAAQQAQQAVILMVAAHGQRGLPPLVREWIEEWLNRSSENPRAMVLSLDAAGHNFAAADQIITPIESAARQAGVEFFVHFDEPLTGHRERPLANPPRYDAPPTWLGVASEFQVERHSHWGINE